MPKIENFDFCEKSKFWTFRTTDLRVRLNEVKMIKVVKTLQLSHENACALFGMIMYAIIDSGQMVG